MSICSDSDDNLYISDYHRVTKVVYENYMYYAQPIAGIGGENGRYFLVTLN